MRPVQRPKAPAIEYKTYQSYLTPLLNAFGQHCSYCERLEKLDVEHVVPKSKLAGKDLTLQWSNLLLGCARCNRDFKKNINDNRDNHLWPDEANTFLAYRYFTDGRVTVAPQLSAIEQQKAQNTLELVKLDDGIELQNVLNIHRRTQFKIANIALRAYINGHQTLQEILVQAIYAWSVWVTVFNYDNKQRLYLA
ncbi:MAG: hypothetical protein ACI8WB_000655 [Phenylobacterium sp.]|jgi:uncharacterized protein (TIGR02646 family)